MKYIDAEALKAVLEARIEAGLDGYGGNLKWLLETLDSLRQDSILVEFTEKASEIGEKYNYGFGPNLPQPNVDLEKEIEIFTTQLYHDTFGNGQGTLDEFDWEDIATVIEETARHFYELGQLNAR